MKCCIVKDLLPSYIDGLTSADTNLEIEEHLKNCTTCHTVYEQMTADITVDIPSAEKEIDFLKKIKTRMQQKYGLVVLLTFAVLTVLSILLLLIKGIGFDHDFMLYYDDFTLIFVLLPCVWILFTTKSFRAFGWAFLFAVGKRGNSTAAYRESLYAVKMVMAISSVFGCLGFLIGLINGICYADLSSMEGLTYLLRGIPVVILSLFYPLLICVVLMPIYFMLKKHIEDK